MNPFINTILIGLLTNPAMLAQLDAAVLVLLHRGIDQFVAQLSSSPAPARKLKVVRGSVSVTRTRRAPIPPGSLGDRILEVLDEIGAPVNLAAIVPKVGAAKVSVQYAMKQLITARRVVATGRTIDRRFARA